jgi:hypothetical protein
MLNKVCTNYLTKLAATSKTNISPGDGYVYRNGGWQWSPTKQDREQLEKDLKVDQQRRQDDASRAEMQNHLIVDPDSGYTTSVNAGFGTYSNEVPFSSPKPKPKRRSQADILRSAGWSEAEINAYLEHKNQVKTYSKAIGERNRNLMTRQKEVFGVDPKATTWDFHAGLDAFDLDSIDRMNADRKSRGVGPITDFHYYVRNRYKEPTEGMFSTSLLPQVYGSDPVKTWDTAVNGSWTLHPMKPFDRDTAGREIMNDPSVDIENPDSFYRAMQVKKNAYDKEVAAHNAYKHVPGNLYPDHPYYELLSELSKGNMGILRTRKILKELYSMEPEEREVIMDYISRYFHINRALMEQAYNGQINMPERFWDQGWFKKGY